MRRRETPESFRLPRRDDLPALGLYLAAGGLYVLIGVVEPDFLLSWYVGVGYILIVAWLVPTLLKAFAARTPTRRGPRA